MYEQVLLLDPCGLLSYRTASESKRVSRPPPAPDPKVRQGALRRVYGTPDHSPKFGAQSLFTVSKGSVGASSSLVARIRYI